MSTNVTHIGAKKPHYLVLRLCVDCGHRSVGAVNSMEKVFNLECSVCKCERSFISIVPEQYMREFI